MTGEQGNIARFPSPATGGSKYGFVLWLLPLRAQAIHRYQGAAAVRAQGQVLCMTRDGKYGAALFSVREYRRRQYLVEQGKASFWHPYRSLEQACQAAGLP